ncbi:MAG TPA: ABC transporter permease [Pyrinomonadaceae bacterium]
MSITTNNSAGTLEPAVEDTQAAPPANTTPQRQAPRPLPDEPVATIGAGRPWWALNLSELWPYRELLYFLIWRDVKVRYKQTALGVAWVVMQPLLSTLVFTIFLGYLARVPSDLVPYPLFAFAGLMLWTFFSSAVTGSGSSIVGSANLITKVYFPRMLIPAASVCGRLVDFSVAFVVLAGLMLYYGIAPTWQLLWLPMLIALLTLLAVGVGMWASAVNVKYRDVGVALPVLVQFWMFASPVVYPAILVPREWRWLYNLNPLVGILEGFRSALFGRSLDWAALSFSAGLTLVLLVYSSYTFRRMEKGFADVV